MQCRKLLAVGTMALLATGCGEERNGRANTHANAAVNADANGMMDTSQNPASSVMPTDAEGFVQALAASDLYEIESSRIARQKAVSADLKSFAQRLEREHGNSTVELKAVAVSNGISVPAPALNAGQQAMMEELRAATGAEFDSTYIQQQRMAHQMALMLIQNYRNSGDNEALKGLAAKAQPMIETHLDLLNYMKR